MRPFIHAAIGVIGISLCMHYINTCAGMGLFMLFVSHSFIKDYNSWFTYSPFEWYAVSFIFLCGCVLSVVGLGWGGVGLICLFISADYQLVLETP